MSPSRVSVLCAMMLGCVDTKRAGEDTGPEASGFTDGTSFDEASGDGDALDFDGSGDLDGADGDTDGGATADGSEDDVPEDTAAEDDTAVEEDTAAEDDTASEPEDTDGGGGEGSEAGSSDDSSSIADGGTGGTGGTPGDGTTGGGTTGGETTGVGTTGGDTEDGGTDGTSSGAAPTFVPNRIYINWYASFRDGRFTETLALDAETGVAAPTDNFVRFYLTTEAFDIDDASSFCRIEFYIDESVPTDFDSWSGWENMAFELDTTVGTTPPSSGCTGMTAAMGIEDPISDYLSGFPWAFGYGPMKSTWADTIRETEMAEDFTSLGDAAGTVHLRYSLDESEGLTEWGYFEVNPYDSAMVIDDGSVVRGVSSAAEPPDGRYIMTSVYMITIS